jgi:outer membrane protein TolC
MTKTILSSALLVLLAGRPAWAEEPRALSLRQAMDELDAHNPGLAEARGRVAQAHALIAQASSALLPSVAASGGYVRNSDEAKVGLGGVFQALGQAPPPGVPGTLVIQPLQAWTIAGSLKIPLLAPSAWAERSAARHGSEATMASAAAIRLQLHAVLVEAAWAAAAAADVVTASRHAVEVAGEHSRTAARMVEAGEAPPLTSLKAETEVVRRESDLVRAQAELERARLALGVLLGRVEPVRVLLPAPPGSAEPPRPAEDLAVEAFARRPELQVDAAKRRAAESQVLAAKLRWLPQLSGSASAFASNSPYPTGKKDGWRLTLDATWLLYDGGYRGGRREQADAEVEVARAVEDSARLSIAEEVADALRDVGVAAERLRLAERQSDFANQAAASAKRTFEAGVAGSLEVLDANDRLYQAEVAVADARGRLGIARAQLTKAAGHDFTP